MLRSGLGLLGGWGRDRLAGHRGLVAVSGGADSVALVLALREVMGAQSLVVVHFNHGWRGEAAAADQLFVVKLAKSLALKCVTNATIPVEGCVCQFDSSLICDSAMLAKGFAGPDLIASESVAGKSQTGPKRSEDGAREARYAFLVEAAYRHGASYIATGHTADDRVETLLHHLFRGTGLSGAASIAASRSLADGLLLVHPLIDRSRTEVLEFLAARNQEYRHDSSNDDLRYSRNYVRHRLLPEIQARYPATTENLLGFADLAEETIGDLERLASIWLEEVEKHIKRQIRLENAQFPLAYWPAETWFVVPRALIGPSQVWSVLQVALRQVWLERSWPQADMSRSHWHAIRDILLSMAREDREGRAVEHCPSKPRTLMTLPGNISVQVDQHYIAFGRCSIGQ